jgi:integrase
MALTDTFVRQVKHSGRPAGDKHTDGGGMYLLVKPGGRYWRLDYTFCGKRKTLALGIYPEVSLAKARKRREKAREQLAEGVDPMVARRQEVEVKANALSATFEAVARDWLKTTAGRRAPVTQLKVKTWLEKDTFPFIGRLPVSEIGPRDVLERVIRKLEARGAIDTAYRVKQLCGQVLRFAVVSGLAERDVTTDLREAMAAKKVGHFAAITEPRDAGNLLRSIHGYSGHPATLAALKLAPLVFVRPGELRTMEWAELDLDAAEWRIPGSKMKMRVDHLVPLATQAVEILRGLQPITGHGRYVFPSIRTGERPMSENTINAALRGMGYSREVHTAHGFRATARTIMDEVLGDRVDLIEHQLAHTVKDNNGRPTTARRTCRSGAR